VRFEKGIVRNFDEITAALHQLHLDFLTENTIFSQKPVQRVQLARQLSKVRFLELRRNSGKFRLQICKKLVKTTFFLYFLLKNQ